MQDSFRQRSSDFQLSTTESRADQVSTEPPRPTNRCGGRPDRCRNRLRRYNSQPRPLLYLTEMMRLAEDGVMFTIARFEKRFSYLQGHCEILRIACGDKKKKQNFSPLWGSLKLREGPTRRRSTGEQEG